MNNNRMKIVIFDTETTGLPKSLEPADKSPNNWPHLVSISWVVIENTFPYAISKQRSYIIKPQNWTIPEDSIKNLDSKFKVEEDRDHFDYVLNTETISEHKSKKLRYHANLSKRLVEESKEKLIYFFL